MPSLRSVPDAHEALSDRGGDALHRRQLLRREPPPRLVRPHAERPDGVDRSANNTATAIEPVRSRSPNCAASSSSHGDVHAARFSTTSTSFESSARSQCGSPARATRRPAACVAIPSTRSHATEHIERAGAVGDLVDEGGVDVEDLGELARSRRPDRARNAAGDDPERAAGEAILQLAQPAVARRRHRDRRHDAAHRTTTTIPSIVSVVGVRGAGQLARAPTNRRGGAAGRSRATMPSAPSVERANLRTERGRTSARSSFVDEVEVAGAGERVGLVAEQRGDGRADVVERPVGADDGDGGVERSGQAVGPDGETGIVERRAGGQSRRSAVRTAPRWRPPRVPASGASESSLRRRSVITAGHDVSSHRGACAPGRDGRGGSPGPASLPAGRRRPIRQPVRRLRRCCRRRVIGRCR